MMSTIRAIIRLRRIDRLLKHLEKAVRLAEKAGLDAKVAFSIERVMVAVSVEAVRIGDETKELNKRLAV